VFVRFSAPSWFAVDFFLSGLRQEEITEARVAPVELADSERDGLKEIIKSALNNSDFNRAL